MIGFFLFLLATIYFSYEFNVGPEKERLVWHNFFNLRLKINIWQTTHKKKERTANELASNRMNKLIKKENKIRMERKTAAA